MKILQSKYIRYVLFFWFAFTAVWTGIMMQNSLTRLEKASGSKDMLDLQSKNTAEGVYKYLSDVGENGRSVLKGIYSFEDFVFPIAYGPFLFLAIAYFFYKSFPNKKYLLWFCAFPVLGVCADYIENFSIINIITSYPRQISTAAILGKITLLKWITVGASVLMLVLSFCLFIAKRYFQKK